MRGAFGPENGQDFRRRPCGLRTALRVISNFVIVLAFIIIIIIIIILTYPDNNLLGVH